MLLPTYTLPQNIPQLGTLVAEFELCMCKGYALTYYYYLLCYSGYSVIILGNLGKIISYRVNIMRTLLKLRRT